MAASTATQTESLVELPKLQTKHATTLHDLSDELLGLIIERVCSHHSSRASLHSIHTT